VTSKVATELSGAIDNDGLHEREYFCPGSRRSPHAGRFVDEIRRWFTSVTFGYIINSARSHRAV
jgi:hypothetical protein